MKAEIDKAVEFLKLGNTILYPTDTIWGIGCDATNNGAVQKIFRIKKRMTRKSLIILLDTPDKLSDYVEKVPEIAYDLIESINSPLTIIYPKAINLAKNVMATDKSIAIRIIRDEFCRKMIHQFGKPVVSTSANLSGELNPITFKMVPDEIVNAVDHVVDLYKLRIKETKPSRIIKLNESGDFDVIRE